MDEHRKNAYRYLLYDAMLMIRSIEWSTHRWHRLINPFFWKRAKKDVSRAAALANWLHNLAFYSSRDFAGFREDDFWASLD